MTKRNAATVQATGKVHITYFDNEQTKLELYGIMPSVLPAVDAATWFLHTTETMYYIAVKLCTGSGCAFCQMAA